MSTKKHDEKFSFLDLIKGGIPNPSGFPIPRPQQDSKPKASQKVHTAAKPSSNKKAE